MIERNDMKKLLEGFRSMKIESRLLLLALACGLIAAALAYIFISSKENEVLKSMEPVRVLVAQKFITPRTQLKEDMVSFEEIPRKFVTSANITGFDSAKGRMALVPFVAGEQILQNKLSAKAEELSSAVPTGMRAISVGCDEESSCGFMIKAGDHVDVLLTFENGRGQNAFMATAMILQCVQVLAVGTDFSGRQKEGREYGSIALAVTPEEAELITYSRQKGRISFALRGLGDTQQESLKMSAFEELVKQIKGMEKQTREQATKPAVSTGADEPKMR
ncbi:MAG: Flp pilus assembly protein CpaB [Spirochaetia bacterium]|nr:Flp pilus assembly protein CpaB [Spirochaetia bacterium]